MTQHFLPTIIYDLLTCHLLELIHSMCLPQRSCLCHRLYISPSSLNNQHSSVLFFHSCCILRWRGVFYSCCWSCFVFLFKYLPGNLTLCEHILHTCYIRIFKTFHSCRSIFFLRSLTLEPYLLVLVLFCFISV